MSIMEQPHVHVSYAQSLDGRIATKTGDSRYISGPESLVLAHRFRAENDAILVGIGTVLADDPMLNCRLPEGCVSQPIRVVLDRRLRTPLDSKIARTAVEQETIVICGKSFSMNNASQNLRDLGIAVLSCPENPFGLDVVAILKLLGERGIESVFVEGGSAVLTSFFRANMVDSFSLVVAPIMIGQGKEAILDMGVDVLADAKRFSTTSVERLGNDLVWHMKRAGGSQAARKTITP